ncbi:type II secretion system F family protein [Clostridium sp. JN-9]|uniref:type II secretion system F family protein n=1 Tax=Clostridium sp. JN-9 TaxID=2507159 RepID=UPI000FFE0E4B|nr:type II secretion system F family protein [Clostridium sp. JN-9]QAT39221.1 type II secretion system protein [Clostridium sp. JN-9]
MANIITVFWFISIFMLVTGILYCLVLRNKNLEKRINYYLDIKEKYKKGSKPYNSEQNFLIKCNEFIRKTLKRMLPGENQHKINKMLISAGVNLKPEEYVMLKWFMAFITGAIVYLFVKIKLLCIIGAVFGYIYPGIWLKNKRKLRLQKFNDALPDMINTIISSLKSGFSIGQAMKTVAEESERPVKDEINVLLNELNYGITMDEALDNLNNRMPSVDLDLMVRAILIQRQVGGNLSSILETIANTIMERKRLERRVRTLTAQGRLSGKIIGVLPFLFGLFIYLINPEYITDFLGNTIGKIAISIGILCALAGYMIINRITKIEV